MISLTDFIFIADLTKRKNLNNLGITYKASLNLITV